MKLKHITFTGLDANTSVSDLVEIQKKYPIAEFGVLMSKNWETNGNRYPNPELVQRFMDQGLNLSAHLCGHLAREAYKGRFEPVISVYQAFEHPDFKRVQLNVAPYDEIYMEAQPVMSKIDKEIIIQQRSPDMLYSQAFNMFELKNMNLKVSMLIDPSGGRGMDSSINLMETDFKTGYAGGINEDNVEEKLLTLLTKENLVDIDFWIDMESGVRTNDWFDINKVVNVLEKCDKVIKDFE